MIDYTDEEISAVQQTLDSRYKEHIEIHPADCEVQPDRNRPEIVERPVLFWHARKCNFLMVKMNAERYRGHFFYRPDEHFDHDQMEYSDPVNCALAMLRIQSDHERESQGVPSGSFGSDLT